MKVTYRVPHPKDAYAFVEVVSEFPDNVEPVPATVRTNYDLLKAALEEKSRGTFKEIVTFTGETILYDADQHIYTTLDGRRLLSGSAYKKSLEAPFPETMAATIAKKYSVPEADIRAMWKMNSFCSSKFGDALHKAMELYRKYGHLAESLKEKEYFLPKNSTLRNAVLAFPDTSPGFSEIMVSAIERGMVGQIDWLSETAENTGIVEDYKSDADVKKNLAGHFNQLSFYAHILMHHGWIIPSVRVWNWTGGEWVSYESPVLDLKGELTN